MQRVAHLRTLPILIYSFVAGMNPSAEAVFREDFESPETTWEMADADCPARIVSHKRVFDQAQNGNGCEHLQLKLGQGTYAYLLHPITPCRIIDELQPSVWIKSNRAGMQFILRVVLPRTRHPRTGDPLTTLIRGTLYTNAGEWQQLTIPDVVLQLTRQERVLRSQFGSSVDIREAYIDHVVINAYGGPGATLVWLDGLELLGHVPVPLSRTENQTAGDTFLQSVSYSTANYNRHTSSPAQLKRVTLNGTTISVDGRPFVPRMIDHNGERLEWLKSLGFNTVKLKTTPNGSQLAMARELDVWLVVPPPKVPLGSEIPADFDRVLAWSLGNNLSGRDFQTTQQLAIEVKQSDELLKRPILCGADSHIWQYSRLADVLTFDRSPIGTSFPLRQYETWLKGRKRLARPETPCWATIQTQVAHVLEEQAMAMSAGQTATISLEPNQIESMLLNAVAAGVRGIYYKSRTPLHSEDPVNQLRARTLQWLNSQLVLVEPWLAGGFPGESIETSNDQVRGNLLQTARSQLIVLTRTMDDQQYVSGAADERPISFLVPNPSSAPDVYQITAGGLQPLRYQRIAGGIRVVLQNVGATAFVVVTQDPLVVRHITQQLASLSQTVPALKHEILSNQYQQLENRMGQLPLPNSAINHEGLMRESYIALAEAKRMLSSGDGQAADRFMVAVDRSISQLRRSYWEQFVRPFATPVSSPLCVSFDTLPQHLAATQTMRRLQWSNNALAAGDFENLNHVLQSGWRQQRRHIDGVQPVVEFSIDSPKVGRSSLRMRSIVVDASRAPTVIEAPPVWVTSGPVPVKSGQLVKIAGWIMVPNGIERSQDGVTIFDSLGGLPLAARIYDTVGWQPFVLYRASPANGELRLTFALTGIGETQIDGVTVAVATPDSH